MNRVRVTRDAKHDLDEIWLYVARDNIDAASRLLEELKDRFRIIASSPEIGRGRDELKLGLRSHPVGNYVIYYRSLRSHIFILRIVHGARDPRRLFQT